MKKTKKVRKNLKKFRKADFNYTKFIKKYYIEKGEAYISAKVNNIDDIISKYSTKGYEWINPEFVQYIEDNAYHIPVEESIVIEICGAEFNEEEQDTIQRVIKDYFGAHLADKKDELNLNKQRSIALFLFAIISLFIVYFAFRMRIIDVLYEIPMVLLWFFIWEGIDVVLLQRTQLYKNRMESAQLSSAKIRFLPYEKNIEADDKNNLDDIEDIN